MELTCFQKMLICTVFDQIWLLFRNYNYTLTYVRSTSKQQWIKNVICLLVFRILLRIPSLLLISYIFSPYLIIFFFFVSEILYDLLFYVINISLSLVSVSNPCKQVLSINNFNSSSSNTAGGIPSDYNGYGTVNPRDLDIRNNPNPTSPPIYDDDAMGPQEDNLYIRFGVSQPRSSEGLDNAQARIKLADFLTRFRDVYSYKNRISRAKVPLDKAELNNYSKSIIKDVLLNNRRSVYLDRLRDDSGMLTRFDSILCTKKFIDKIRYNK